MHSVKRKLTTLTMLAINSPISPPPARARCRSHGIRWHAHTRAQAFAYNFLSALSAVLGTIIVLSLGETLTDAEISIILLLGAGSFIFIALAELVPEALLLANAVSKGRRRAVVVSQLRKLGSFLLGGVLIGMPFLFDQQCAVSGDGHGH